jgi:hypothetical protein
LEAVSQKRHGRNIFDGEDAFPRVNLTKISHLFDNNLSSGVGGAPSQKPISQKLRGRNFFRGRSWVQDIQVSQNQSFFLTKVYPRQWLGDNVISQLFSKSDLA